jgi:hypothetical protein
MASRWRRWNAEIARWRDTHPWRHATLYGLTFTAGGLLYLLVMRLGGWSTVYDVPTILVVGGGSVLLWGLLGWFRMRRHRGGGPAPADTAYEPPRDRPPTPPW